MTSNGRPGRANFTGDARGFPGASAYFEHKRGDVPAELWARVTLSGLVQQVTGGAMKYAKEDYIRYDPFDGERDINVTCRTVKLVHVRKARPCFLSAGSGDEHDIAVGELARYETALIDRTFWGKYYVCLPCMDKWLEEYSTPLPKGK